MPIDLSNPIKVNVTSVSEKPNGGAKISVEVLEMSQFPFPLHLTPDQAQQLDGMGEYTALLVQSKLKDGKDGSWQSDYWYNAAMFEGVADERNMPKSTPAPTAVEKPTSVQHKPQAPSTTGLIKEEELSQKDRIIVQEISLKLAFEQTIGVNLEEHVYNASLLYPNILDVFYGRFETSPLVEEASKQGAKIVEIRPTEEPLFEPEETAMDGIVWDYKKPEEGKELKSRTDFVEYMQKCGWAMEDVVRWLGTELESYISRVGKGYMTAAKVCKDKALEEGLEPPEDFRQEKKETK